MTSKSHNKSVRRKRLLKMLANHELNKKQFDNYSKMDYYINPLRINKGSKCVTCSKETPKGRIITCSRKCYRIYELKRKEQQYKRRKHDKQA